MPKPLDPVKEAAAVQSLRASLAALGADGDEQLLLDSIEGQTSLFDAIDLLLERIADGAGLRGPASTTGADDAPGMNPDPAGREALAQGDGEP